MSFSLPFIFPQRTYMKLYALVVGGGVVLAWTNPDAWYNIAAGISLVFEELSFAGYVAIALTLVTFLSLVTAKVIADLFREAAKAS
jgi:hypothetical protein